MYLLWFGKGSGQTSHWHRNAGTAQWSFSLRSEVQYARTELQNSILRAEFTMNMEFLGVWGRNSSSISFPAAFRPDHSNLADRMPLSIFALTWVKCFARRQITNSPSCQSRAVLQFSLQLNPFPLRKSPSPIFSIWSARNGCSLSNNPSATVAQPLLVRHGRAVGSCKPYQLRPAEACLLRPAVEVLQDKHSRVMRQVSLAVRHPALSPLVTR